MLPDPIQAHKYLGVAIDRLLATINESPPSKLLWSMHYDQHSTRPNSEDRNSNTTSHTSSTDNVLLLPDLAPTLVLEDDVLKHVRAAYGRIMGDDAPPFMVFEDREGADLHGEVADEGEI